MEIQRLNPAHASTYRTLMLEAYGMHPDAFTSGVDERARLPLSWWAARLDPAPSAAELVLGAFVGGALVGVAGLGVAAREKTRHKATLFGMYVPETARQQGLGTRLVHAVLAEAAARPGVLLVQLTVTLGNRSAQALYERCGFGPFGVEPHPVSVGEASFSKVHMWQTVGHRDLP